VIGQEVSVNQTFDDFAGSTRSALGRVNALRRVQELLVKTAGVVAYGALWGLAAASGNPPQALLSAFKVPMVLCLTVLVALPSILVTRTLLRATLSPIDLLATLVTALYRGSLVLLGFAPLLAVYAYTSQWLSPWLAQASNWLAMGVSVATLVLELRKLDAPPRVFAPLAGVSIVVLGLALLQLIALATPILPVATMFGRGIDGLVSP
jgi:hypothetical protein